MTLLRTSVSVTILLAALIAHAEDSTKYDLKYKFKPGEVVRSEVVHQATVETTIKGTSQTADTRTKSVKAWKIDAAKQDGSVTFTHMIESVDMWNRMQGRKEMRYNSQIDKTPPQGFEETAKHVGVPITAITMDLRGKVLKREEKLKQANANPTQITLPLPTEPIEIGHQWNTPETISVEGKSGIKQVELRQVYTLKNVSAGVATIDLETQVLTPVNDPVLEAHLIQRMTTGTVKFDIDAGRVISQVTDLDRRVIGFSGPASSMHYLTRVEEKLLSPAPQNTTPKPATPTAAAPKTAMPKIASTKPAPPKAVPSKTATPKSGSKLRR